MKILFISSDYPRPEKGSNIYTDLAESLNNNNHAVKVVVAEEKKKIDNTELFEENGIPVLRVKTGNLYEVGFIEKTLTFLTLISFGQLIQILLFHNLMHTLMHLLSNN